MAASFAPHRWFARSTKWWDEMKLRRSMNPKVQQRYFQREDFRFCAKIADEDGKPRSARLTHFICQYHDFPSEARTATAA